MLTEESEEYSISTAYTGASSGLYHRVRCARFTRTFTPEDAIAVHAFAPLEALPGMGTMTFLSGAHSSYRLAL
jgi:hypothetical protein